MTIMCFCVQNGGNKINTSLSYPCEIQRASLSDNSESVCPESVPRPLILAQRGVLNTRLNPNLAFLTCSYNLTPRDIIRHW